MKDPRIAEVLISAAQIRQRVRSLAAEIRRDHADSTELHLVGVLNGAFMFMADLARALRRAGAPPVHYAFLRARTYGTTLKGSPLPQVEIDYVPRGLEARDVILVEDILDQGVTLQAVCAHLRERVPMRSLKLCVLLVKDLDRMSPAVKAARRAVRPEYVGFHVPDRWVAGYGLDAGGELRDLPCVAAVHEKYFT